MLAEQEAPEKQLLFTSEPTLPLVTKPSSTIMNESASGKKEDSPLTHVNDSYDAMPNEIEDPAAVFKLAFLDAERGRLQTQALLAKQEGDQNIKAMQIQYQTTINELQRQIREIEIKIKEHRDYIEKKYNIALRSYNYDDETGVLRKQLTTEQAGTRR